MPVSDHGLFFLNYNMHRYDSVMASHDIQPPREHTDLDDEITAAEEEVRRLKFWRTGFWAVVCGWVAGTVVLVTTAFITRNSAWENIAGVRGLVLPILGLFTYGFLLAAPSGGIEIGRSKYIAAITQLERLKARRREQRNGRGRSKTAMYERYKESLPELVERYRLVANHYRRIYNSLQAFVVVGALSASALAGAFESVKWARWSAVILSSAVGISSAVGSHFKLSERSSEMQRAADLIEIELRAVEFGIGDYDIPGGSEAILKKFVEKVEQIRTEHMTQKRQLDQPSDVSFVDSSSIG
jgi:hypothetical protein